jgi:hypothetical protein
MQLSRSACVERANVQLLAELLLVEDGPCVQERGSFWIDKRARYLCVAAMINEGAELLLLDRPSALLM